MTNPWLRQLLDAVGDCWQWQALALQIGVQYREPDDEDPGWEVSVYPAMQEILGGEHDGETGWCSFNFNLTGLLEEFLADDISFSTKMADTPPEIVLEGKFRGQELVLHVYLEPPEDAEPTEIVDLTKPGGARIREKE